eukprot:g36505.t1
MPTDLPKYPVRLPNLLPPDRQRANAVDQHPRFTVWSDIIPGPSKPQVQLMSHKQLGYDGRIKCEMRAVKVGDFYDWRHQEGADPPPTKTHTKAITYGTNALISAQGHYKGFKDLPLFAHLQEDCIQQSVEDALHLVEGCIKRRLFRLLTGQKIFERPGTGRTWEHWLQSLKDWELPPASLKILDERWLKLCAATGRTTHAAPCKSPGSMTGEKWYILASQCGEWIFDDLLSGDRKQYVVTLCTLYRLFASPNITGRVVGALARLEGRFQTLHRKLLPPIAAPLVFHRIGHIIECPAVWACLYLLDCPF